ncbi:MAG: hypothetical protein H6666_09470 [Ardenticatenaceae bacterium]|nr:hypothetical protein [Ardenticatenaceae bacterium]
MTRVERILTILLVILLVAVVVMAVLFWLRPGGGNPAGNSIGVGLEPTSVFQGQTAQVAFASAQAAARGWQPDAQLLKATATWPQGTGRDKLIQGESTWNFTFYAPASQSIAVITITDGQASLDSTKTLSEPIVPAPLDITGWQLDSRAAIQRMLAAGGDSFLSSASYTILTVALTTSNESQRIEWLISLLATQSGSAYTMRIDATTGEILEIIQSP